MTKFTIHTLEAAPVSSRPLLDTVKKGFGFVPNLHATLAESPAALKGALALSQAFEESTLSPIEQQVVAIVTSVSNKAPFDVAMHSTLARNTVKVPGAVVDLLRTGGSLTDPKLQALAAFTRAVVEKRGWSDEAHLTAFTTAGYTKAQALEVVMGVAMKVFTNYVDHLAATTLNEEFKAEAWERYPKAA